MGPALPLNKQGKAACRPALDLTRWPGRASRLKTCKGLHYSLGAVVLKYRHVRACIALQGTLLRGKGPGLHQWAPTSCGLSVNCSGQQACLAD